MASSAGRARYRRGPGPPTFAPPAAAAHDRSPAMFPPLDSRRIDARRRRRMCLEALHEMRAMAHIVDMHQLTKDPEIVTSRGPGTPSSPERPLDRFELGRYLDYCSEMLSLIGKVAALYVQGFPDQ